MRAAVVYVENGHSKHRAYNGFEQGRAWVDLCPDMELRVEDADYEPVMSRHGLAGFPGTAVAQYNVGSNGRLQLLSVGQ
jgi:hypothetical protein